MNDMVFDAEIELTSQCQLSCPFCRTGGALRKEYPQVPRGIMKRETFERIMAEVPKFNHVLLYNWGEPFLHPDLIWFVENLRPHAESTEISTNMQIMTRAHAEGLVHGRLDTLRVSCDGITQESYEKYRVGGDLSKVLKHSRFLAETKRALGAEHPKILFQFVVNRFNEHELDDFDDFAREHGADETTYIHIGAMTPEGRSQIGPFIPRNRDWQEQWNIGKLRDCKQPFEHLSIDWNGDVYPCCNPSGVRKYSLGNLLEQSFEEVWNGEKHSYSRRFCKTGKAEDNGLEIMCHACYDKFPTETAREEDMWRPVLPERSPRSRFRRLRIPLLQKR
jgi:radical SAM protein with 4Fe4S-binding SPASM domain